MIAHHDIDTYPVKGLTEMFREHSEKSSDRTALVFPKENVFGKVEFGTVSFKQLDEISDQYADCLIQRGIRPAMRVLFMVRPGLDFIALTFSLCKIAAVPVFIDPGMGLKAMLRCIADAQPQAMVAVPLVSILKKIYPRYFSSIQVSVITGISWFQAGAGLRKATDIKKYPTPGDDDLFAIVFTSGSTGVPKGVVYQHRTMKAQIMAITSNLGLSNHDTILQGFAPFALRDIVMGATCILPNMNPARPAAIDPRDVITLVRKYEPTFSFGSPAFWSRTVSYCIENQLTLPSFRSVMLAGAPVQSRLIRELKSILSESAEVHTPYGSTEALPLTSIAGKEILEYTADLTAQGSGICVGRPLTGVDIRIIKITDEPIVRWNPALELKTGDIGEIVVKGKMVTREYINKPKQTADAKIEDTDATWHRMGDVGYMDNENRLWYCGRKDDRVITKTETLYTIPCEGVFNQHKDVFRSALIGVGNRGSQRPVIVIELFKERVPKEPELLKELKALGSRYAHTRAVEHILFHPGLPVDRRHNSKILRSHLVAWTEKKTT